MLQNMVRSISLPSKIYDISIIPLKYIYHSYQPKQHPNLAYADGCSLILLLLIIIILLLIIMIVITITKTITKTTTTAITIIIISVHFSKNYRLMPMFHTKEINGLYVSILMNHECSCHVKSNHYLQNVRSYAHFRKTACTLIAPESHWHDTRKKWYFAVDLKVHFRYSYTGWLKTNVSAAFESLNSNWIRNAPQYCYSTLHKKFFGLRCIPRNSVWLIAKHHPTCRYILYLK